MNINDKEHDPEPWIHAVRHLDNAEDLLESGSSYASNQVIGEALIGIGWAILAAAKNISKLKD